MTKIPITAVGSFAKKHWTEMTIAHTVVASAVVGFVLYKLALLTMIGLPPFRGENGASTAAIMFTLATILATIVQIQWPQKSRGYLFAVSIGTAIAFVLIGFKSMLFGQMVQNPFIMALGIVGIVLAWRSLFGPWRVRVKLAVLLTFLFWISLQILLRNSQTQPTAYATTIAIAIVPALIWCWLFMRYHKQRRSLVVLMFIAGMLSTAPILFYDTVLRSGVQLQFFLFRIVPESFTQSSSIFVSSSLNGVNGYQSTLVATLISFLLVGLIEEVGKFWVLKKSGAKEFTSIDDVLQLGIIVAIGFAFAENVLNPTYFLTFVRQYLVDPASPNWSGFLGNVLGRSVLTNMVHIVSTGVLAYFYGLALFAKPYLEDGHRQGKHFYLVAGVARLFRVPEKHIFRLEMMTIGFVVSIVLHGLFNFLVTLPNILPGNPKTIGDVFNLAPGSIFHMMHILLLPSLFYVVGGFWLITTLFYRREAMKERGHLVQTDTFVSQPVVA